MVRSKGPYISCLFTLLAVGQEDPSRTFERTEAEPGYNPTMCGLLGLHRRDATNELGFLASRELATSVAEGLDKFFKSFVLKPHNKTRRVIPFVECQEYLLKHEDLEDFKLLRSFLERVWKEGVKLESAEQHELEPGIRDRLVEVLTFNVGEAEPGVTEILHRLNVERVRLSLKFDEPRCSVFSRTRELGNASWSHSIS
jgi:hypothetical protein